MNSPTIVGLDISLRGLGVAVVHGHPRYKIGEGFEAETAVFRVGEDTDGPERLSVLCHALWSWLRSRDACRRGDVYVIEGYGFASQRAHSLGELGGCIRRMIYESGGNMIIVPPSTLKKFLTGSGAADKSVVMKHIYKRWDFDVDDDNQCDAFGCAVLGLIDAGDSVQWDKIETAILTEKVERYAGKGQAAWISDSASGQLAERTRRPRSRRDDLRPAVLGEDTKGPRRRRKYGA